LSGPWREVVYIGDERVGPKGGRTRLLTLSCGHLFAWRSSAPKSLHRALRSTQLAPKRARCLLCASELPASASKSGR